MLFGKSYKKWTEEEKKKFAKETFAYAKQCGIPLKKKKIAGSK